MIYVVNNKNKHLFSDLLDRMYIHRKLMFIDRLKWDLHHEEGMEKDQFDNEDTLYLLLVDDTGELISSLRLIPTLKPHLMSELFKHLCEHSVPRDEDIWEISRYCSNPNIVGRQSRVLAFNKILCGVFEYALLGDCSKLTFVVGMPILPHCISCGWDIKPLGLPQRDKKSTICAFEVTVAEEGLLALRKNANIDGAILNVTARNQRAA